MSYVRVRIICPGWSFPEVPIEPQHLQEAIETVAFSDSLPPKCSIKISLDFLYKDIRTDIPEVVFPVDERLRTFLSYQPAMGAGFIHKLIEWVNKDPREDPFPEETEEAESDLITY